MTDEDDMFAMRNDDLKPTHVEMKRVVQSDLKVNQKSLLDFRIQSRLNTNFVGIFETASHVSDKRKKTPIY